MYMTSFVEWIDHLVLRILRTISAPLGRLSLFIVYFWFGILKVLGTSSANSLVGQLLERTIPFLTFDQFIVGFGFFEMLIGFLFLLPRYERLAIALLIPHLLTTILPLFLLPSVTWQYFLVPTMEGQYIIKNVVIVSLAFSLAVHLRPLRRSVD